MEDRLMMKKLLSRIKCNICGHRYSLENIKNSSRRNGMWFFETFCPHCSTRSLIAVVVKKEKVLEIITDLQIDELPKFKKVNPVGCDDVISVHSFLKNFDGDFATLFIKK